MTPEGSIESGTTVKELTADEVLNRLHVLEEDIKNERSRVEDKITAEEQKISQAQRASRDLKSRINPLAEEHHDLFKRAVELALREDEAIEPPLRLALIWADEAGGNYETAKRLNTNFYSINKLLAENVDEPLVVLGNRRFYIGKISGEPMVHLPARTGIHNLKTIVPTTFNLSFGWKSTQRGPQGRKLELYQPNEITLDGMFPFMDKNADHQQKSFETFYYSDGGGLETLAIDRRELAKFVETITADKGLPSQSSINSPHFALWIAEQYSDLRLGADIKEAPVEEWRDQVMSEIESAVYSELSGYGDNLDTLKDRVNLLKTALPFLPVDDGNVRQTASNIENHLRQSRGARGGARVWVERCLVQVPVILRHSFGLEVASKN